MTKLRKGQVAVLYRSKDVMEVTEEINQFFKSRLTEIFPRALRLSPGPGAGPLKILNSPGSIRGSVGIPRIFLCEILDITSIQESFSTEGPRNLIDRVKNLVSELRKLKPPDAKFENRSTRRPTNLAGERLQRFFPPTENRGIRRHPSLMCSSILVYGVTTVKLGCSKVDIGYCITLTQYKCNKLKLVFRQSTVSSVTLHWAPLAPAGPEPRCGPVPAGSPVTVPPGASDGHAALQWPGPGRVKLID